MTKKNTKREEIVFRRLLIAMLSVLLVTALVLLVLIATMGNTTKSENGQTSNNDSNISTPMGDNNSTPSGDSGTKQITATVLNTGDILIHDNVLWGAKQSDGSYDFSKLFKEAKPYIQAADYAVANLEVTLGGEAAGPYKGYPNFNCPDSLADCVKTDGFDMLLTANNHILDNGVAGMKRTMQQLKAKGIDFLGTRENNSDPTYIIKEINGIKIGMISYTYGTNSGSSELINSFNSSNLNKFYTEAQSAIDAMKNGGAEAIVFYMHWGDEYHTTPNTYQKAVAQQLCNMGVDVIVGGHPHVLQPIDLLFAEGSEHTTVCLYSTGNAVSNQRISEMTGLCETGHTEDGVLFNYTFTRDSDGDVSLSAVDIIPTWVDRYGNAGNYQYTVYPLETADMAENYGLDANTVAKAKASYERTKKIMAEGLSECQQHLGCEIRFAE
ncbi:MAG: CapA family protein [Clostridia bacterium]|nr:CapA family protein [Clostridia bacterium]